MRILLCMLALLLCGGAATATTIPGDLLGYEITRVARVDRRFDNIYSQIPEMLETGDVLFTARPTGQIHQLFIGSPGVVTSNSGQDLSGTALGYYRGNSVGDVVFSGRIIGAGDRSRVFSWSPSGGRQLIYDTTGGSTTAFGSFLSEPALNDSGQVAVVASAFGLPEAIFLGDSSGALPVTPIASTGGPLYEGLDEFFGDPKLMNDGTVYMVA